MCIKIPAGTKLPSAREQHKKWVGSAHNSKILKRGFTALTFQCGGDGHNVILKGVHLSKYKYTDRVDKAHLMREAGDRFYLLVDISVHGVNQTARNRGGHYLFIITRAGTGWKVKRIYYSLAETRRLNLESIQFHNVYWRILKHCYYKVAIEDDMENGNST